MSTPAALEALRQRLLKGGIDPEHLAALVSETLNGTIAKAARAAQQSKEIRQMLWDQFFAAALSGVASAWVWEDTTPIVEAEHAARLADAALTVRDRRFSN